MCAEALGGSDSQEVSGPMAFPCHFRVFSFHRKEEEVGGGNPKPLCRARRAHGFSVRDPHIKGSICVFTEGHMEVTQMPLRCKVAVTEAAPAPQPAWAAQHSGPERAPCASESVHAVSGACQTCLRCPLKKLGFSCNTEPPRTADPSRLSSTAERGRSSRKMVSAFGLEVCSM